MKEPRKSKKEELGSILYSAWSAQAVDSRQAKDVHKREFVPLQSQLRSKWAKQTTLRLASLAWTLQPVVCMILSIPCGQRLNEIVAVATEKRMWRRRHVGLGSGALVHTSINSLGISGPFLSEMHWEGSPVLSLKRTVPRSW